MYRIGVISDTHGLLRPEVEEQLKHCDVILHAGDIDRQKVLEALNEIAPVYAVRGNADREWAEHIPMTRKEELFGLRVFMIHNKKQISEDISDCGIVIYGHSHKYDESFLTENDSSENSANVRPGVQRTEETGESAVAAGRGLQEKEASDVQLWLNPGSCGPRRFTMPITMAVIETDGSGTYRVRRVDIPHRGASNSGKPFKDSKRKSDQMIEYTADGRMDERKADSEMEMQREMKRVNGDMLASVIHDINSGKSVSAIAGKNKLSRELTEHICRLYLTHPGIDAEGILDKMDIHDK
ncbi:MAG: metallophosphatase family protein [Clostridiales bacterium]|nr:metallophosphatase family protein [Clostridiales bacterium]